MLDAKILYEVLYLKSSAFFFLRVVFPLNSSKILFCINGRNFMSRTKSRERNLWKYAEEKRKKNLQRDLMVEVF